MVKVVNENSKIEAYLVDEKDIINMESLIPEKERVVKETMLIHQVIWVKEKKIIYFSDIYHVMIVSQKAIVIISLLKKYNTL